MKRSKSSHPILISNYNQAVTRQRSFISNKQSKLFTKQKFNPNELKLEKVFADAEDFFEKEELEKELLSYNKEAFLKHKDEVFALSAQKSHKAVINDLKYSCDDLKDLKEKMDLLNIKNFDKNHIYFGTDIESVALQKAVQKFTLKPKISSRSEHSNEGGYISDTAKSMFKSPKQKGSEQVYNLKIYDGNEYKVVSATKHDVKEYMKDKDYFKMKEQNAKEWKKLRSEMNKKIAEKEAIERYEKEAKLLEEKSSIRQYCEEQVTLIGRYYQNGKISDVIRFSENFIKYLNKKDDTLLSRKWVYLATAFNYLGRAFIEQNNFEKAKMFGEKLYKIAISSANTELITQSYILSGKIYVKFGRYEEAAFVWEKLKPLIEDFEKKSWLFHEIGRCYFEMGKYDYSYKYGVDSAYWAEKCSSSVWLSSANVLQAQSEMKRNNYENALKKFLEAKKHAEICNDENILKYIQSIEEGLAKALKINKT